MGANELTVLVERHPAGMTNIILSGKLDASTIDIFEAELEKLYTEKCFILSFDLTELESVSSAGIGSLINIFTTLDENDGYGEIKGMNDRVKDAFNLVGFSPENKE